MVTTRSADHQLSADVKTDNLTLRSKPEVVDNSAVLLPHSTVSTPSSSRKRSTISVNVPPPRKRTRLSHDGVVESEAEAFDYAAVATKTPQSELPTHQNAQAQSFGTQFNLSGSVEPLWSSPSPGSTRNGKRRGRSNENTHGSTEKATSSLNKNHTRFSDEDPVDKLLVSLGNSEQADSLTNVNVAESDHDDDDDDAEPEVESIRTTTASSLPKQRKKNRTQKSTTVQIAGEPGSAPQRPTSSMFKGAEPDQEAPSPKVKPILSGQQGVVVSQEATSANPALDSDDSNDQSFETAQTTRQKDAFATPEEGMSALTSPTFPHTTTGHQRDAASLSFKNVNIPIDNLSSNLALLGMSRSKIRPRAVQTSATALPPKAGTSLERYRRQVLRNRADKTSGSKRGEKFKLQEDWPGKRRRFVIGY